MEMFLQIFILAQRYTYYLTRGFGSCTCKTLPKFPRSLKQIRQNQANYCEGDTESEVMSLSPDFRILGD